LCSGIVTLLLTNCNNGNAELEKEKLALEKAKLELESKKLTQGEEANQAPSGAEGDESPSKASGEEKLLPKPVRPIVFKTIPMRWL